MVSSPQVNCVKSEHTMILEDLKSIAAELEKQELQAPGGVSPPELYCKLLAIYLYENDLCNAKYLWKRVPLSVKSSCPELTAIWAVSKAGWQKDPEARYAALNFQWSPNIAPIMKAVIELLRERAQRLISEAYSSISVASAATLLGLSQADTLTLANQLGWPTDGCFIMPRPPAPTKPQHTTTQCQLQRLTEFVSFLEN